jgi:hypothetical protein
MTRAEAAGLAARWAQRAETAHNTATLTAERATNASRKGLTYMAADEADRRDDALRAQDNAIRMATMWTNLAAVLLPADS